MSNPTTQTYYTTGEVAELLRYADERPVVRAIRRGEIPATRRPDGRYLIPVSYLRGAHEIQAPAPAE